MYQKDMILRAIEEIEDSGGCAYSTVIMEYLRMTYSITISRASLLSTLTSMEEAGWLTSRMVPGNRSGRGQRSRREFMLTERGMQLAKD